MDAEKNGVSMLKQGPVEREDKQGSLMVIFLRIPGCCRYGWTADDSMVLF
jgi:hypothetical protein